MQAGERINEAPWISAAAIDPFRPPDAKDALELLVEEATEYAVVTLSPTGLVASWNNGAERIAGYRKAEIIGRHFSLFSLPEDRLAGLPEWLLSAAVRDGHVTAEGWRLRKDGSRFWAQVVITALWDEAGGLRGFAKLTRDETERRDLEELRHRAARRAEQERIAGGLADTLVGRLFSVGLDSAAARRLTDDPRVGDRIETAMNELDDAIGSLRRVMFESDTGI